MWFVYIVRCADGSFYTGVTSNLKSRIMRHNAGRGAKYTRLRRPVVLAYSEALPDRSSALRREYEIKKLTKPEKEALCRS